MTLERVKRSPLSAELPVAAAGPTAKTKPSKPYPDFPLFPHATRRWAKKIRGKFVFFGPWDDPYGALERYVSQRDALHVGLVARPAAPALADAAGSPRAARRATHTLGVSGAIASEGSLTLRDLANRFLSAKQRQVDAGEMSPRSFYDYHRTAGLMLGALSKDRRVDDITASDFGKLRMHLADGRGPVALGSHIQKIRTMFKFAYDGGLIDRPVRYGPEFQKPSKKAMRQARNQRPARMFEATEIKTLLAGAGVQMRAMILLGINAGMGNTDVSSLPRSGLNLKSGLLTFPRPKTGVPRMAPLWPETVEAIRAALKVRPEAKDPAAEGLAFVTKYGKPWVRSGPPGARSKMKGPAVAVDSVGLEFGKLMREAGLSQPGRSFYALRHTFRTIADEVRDRPAIDLIMGHQDGNDVAAHYVERISDERLRKVTEHVRAWLGLIA